jgi:hypothetical protein
MFVLTSSVEGSYTHLVLSFLATLLLIPAAALVGLPLMFFLVFLLFLVLLPFVCVSISVEAWWRIRHNKPCVAPSTAIHYKESAQSAPSQDCGNWLVPLAIGLWLGHWWNNDH